MKKIILSIAMLGAVSWGLAANAQVVLFSSPLSVGSRGEMVKQLQQDLLNFGFYSGPVTGYFGPLTKNAVINFQEKYSSEILKPNNLISGTGYFGYSSIAQLNKIKTPVASPKSDTTSTSPSSQTVSSTGTVSNTTNVNSVGNNTNTTNTTKTSNTNQPPVISSLQPSSGSTIETVTILGSGFTPTGNKIKFGDQGSENNPRYVFDSVDGKKIIFSVPESNYFSCWDDNPPCSVAAFIIQPGTYKVSVINANGVSNEVDFTVVSNW